MAAIENWVCLLGFCAVESTWDFGLVAAVTFWAAANGPAPADSPAANRQNRMRLIVVVLMRHDNGLPPCILLPIQADPMRGCLVIKPSASMSSSWPCIRTDPESGRQGNPAAAPCRRSVRAGSASDAHRAEILRARISAGASPPQ